MQVTFSLKIYIKHFFSFLQKRCQYAVPSRTLTYCHKKPCQHMLEGTVLSAICYQHTLEGTVISAICYQHMLEGTVLSAICYQHTLEGIVNYTDPKSTTLGFAHFRLKCQRAGKSTVSSSIIGSGIKHLFYVLL